MRQRFLPFMLILGVIFGGLFEYYCKSFISNDPKEIENISVKTQNSIPGKSGDSNVELVETITSKTISIKGPKDFKNKTYFLTPALKIELEKKLKKMNVTPENGHKLFFSIKQKGKAITIDTLHYYTKNNCFDIKMGESITITKTPVKREMKCLIGKINNSFYNAALHIGAPASIISECVLGLKQNQTAFRKGAPFKIVYDMIKMPNGFETSTALKYIEFEIKGKCIQLYYFEQKSGQFDFFDEKGSAVKQKNGFQKPLKIRNIRIGDAFGWRIHPITGRKHFHKGVDYQAARGTHIIPAAPGRVIYAGRNGGYGLVVDVSHGNGYTTRYAHMTKILVKNGARVNMTMPLGTVGSTGIATGPHLHFEMHKNGKPINPKTQIYLPQNKLYGVDYKNFCALKTSVKNIITLVNIKK